MPIPAVTLKHNTIHSNQNCGVLIALLAETWPTETIDPIVGGAGVQPCGCQSGRGTRTNIHPSDMNTAYTTPCTRKVLAMPVGLVPNKPSIAVDHGDAINAPPPNPMIANPVAMPGLSGNHFIKV